MAKYRFLVPGSAVEQGKSLEIEVVSVYNECFPRTRYGAGNTVSVVPVRHGDVYSINGGRVVFFLVEMRPYAFYEDPGGSELLLGRKYSQCPEYIPETVERENAPSGELNPSSIMEEVTAAFPRLL